MKRIVFVLVTTFLFSCSEEDTTPPSHVSFVSPTVYYSEFDGIFFVPLKLDKPQFGYSSIDFTTSYPNTSTSDEDFIYINQFLPLTFYGGTTLGKISGAVYDDDIADGNDTVEFTLETASSNVLLPSSAEERTGRVVIVDDDDIPADQMLIQLKWTATGARNDREDANFDLTLLTDVVIDGGIESSTTVLSSQKLDQFESILVDESLPDGVYYLRVDYKMRTPSVTGEANPVLKLSGFGHTDSGDNRWGFAFAASEVNYYSWAGPFTKKGRTFVHEE